MRFSGKKVFITGASRGIGNAIGKAFRDEGARVIGTHTGKNRIEDETCHEWVVTDFSDIEQIKE